MKVYCISDLHGQLDNLDFSGADLVVIAGDFAKMSGWGKWHHYDMKKWIEKKFIPFTLMYKHAEFAVVPGNHDLVFDKSKTCIYSDMDYRIKWPSNVHLLIDSFAEIKGLKIYGTPWIPIINYKWAFEAEHDVLLDHFRQIPYNLDILISHSPPRILDSYVDYSLQTGYGPFGSSELAEAIFAKMPKYVFCGHIHSGSHDCLEFGKSKIYNVSRLDENYEIAYKPLVLDV